MPAPARSRVRVTVPVPPDPAGAVAGAPPPGSVPAAPVPAALSSLAPRSFVPPQATKITAAMTRLTTRLAAKSTISLPGRPSLATMLLTVDP